MIEETVRVCGVCGEDLVSDVNWPLHRQRIQHNICRTCYNDKINTSRRLDVGGKFDREVMGIIRHLDDFSDRFGTTPSQVALGLEQWRDLVREADVSIDMLPVLMGVKV